MRCKRYGLCTYSISSIAILSQEGQYIDVHPSYIHTQQQRNQISVPISVNNISCLERVGDTPLQQFIREYTVFSLGVVSFWGDSSPNESGCGSSARSRGLYLKSEAQKVKQPEQILGCLAKTKK